MKGKKGANFDMFNLIYIVIIGFVILQVASWVMTNFFDKDPIQVGPLVMGFIIVIAAWGGFGLAYRVSRTRTTQKESRKAIILIAIAAVIMYLLFTQLPDLVPEFFRIAP